MRFDDTGKEQGERRGTACTRCLPEKTASLPAHTGACLRPANVQPAHGADLPPAHMPPFAGAVRPMKSFDGEGAQVVTQGQILESGATAVASASWSSSSGSAQATASAQSSTDNGCTDTPPAGSTCAQQKVRARPGICRANLPYPACLRASFGAPPPTYLHTCPLPTSPPGRRQLRPALDALRQLLPRHLRPLRPGWRRLRLRHQHRHHRRHPHWLHRPPPARPVWLRRPEGVGQLPAGLVQGGRLLRCHLWPLQQRLLCLCLCHRHYRWLHRCFPARPVWLR